MLEDPFTVEGTLVFRQEQPNLPPTGTSIVAQLEEQERRAMGELQRRQIEAGAGGCPSITPGRSPPPPLPPSPSRGAYHSPYTGAGLVLLLQPEPVSAAARRALSFRCEIRRRNEPATVADDCYRGRAPRRVQLG